ncbi:hypothetical protein BMETH_277_3 [methanotrophic bacterial endosymbiont of Bathymodiolus sp.]|nr:hypothetical protein BMETH_277_3 [methanotrophic bacterial endosymbiont of Bathymodiolus sp.]
MGTVGTVGTTTNGGRCTVPTTKIKVGTVGTAPYSVGCRFFWS